MTPTVMEAAQGRDPRAVVPEPVQGDTAAWEGLATQFLDCFVRVDFDAARALMEPSTAERLTVERLSAGWNSVAVPCGVLSAPEVTSVERVRGAVVVTMAAKGESGTLTMRVHQNDDHRVVGATIN